MRADAKKELRGVQRPELARAELLDKALRARFEAELDAVMKRKPASEARLAGALRAVAAYIPELRSALARAAVDLGKRGAFSRDLYGAAVREIAEANDKRASAILKSALAADDG